MLCQHSLLLNLMLKKSLKSRVLIIVKYLNGKLSLSGSEVGIDINPTSDSQSKEILVLYQK